MPTTDSLKSLHTAIVDARKGYAEAEKDAEKQEVKAMLARMAMLHEDAHADIHAILLAAGETADDGGSFMATVHKAAVAVRSAITGLDRQSLQAFAAGEERIVRDYDSAITEQASDAAVVDTLRRHRDALVDMVAQMKSLAP